MPSSRTGIDRQPDRRQPRRHALSRAFLGAIAFAGLCAAAPQASAQFGYGYARVYPGPFYYEEAPPPMPPRAVVYRLQDRGFTEIARPRFDGTAYIVDATNPVGARVRLFLDARDGAVIGRQRLDTPYYPSNRVARAPGYGWTEDDVASRRAGRGIDAPIPPADVPLPRPSLRTEPDRAPPAASRSPSRAPAGGAPAVASVSPDGNALGLNPDAKGVGATAGGRDAKGRAATPAPRKTARLTNPSKPAAPASAPAAPAPQQGPTEQAAPSETPTPAPDAAKAESTPATPAPAQPPVAETPTEKPAEKPAEAQAETQTEPPAAAKPASEKAGIQTKASDQGWQDPPASDEAKRNVRVIGGATVVPGGDAAAASGAN